MKYSDGGLLTLPARGAHDARPDHPDSSTWIIPYTSFISQLHAVPTLLGGNHAIHGTWHVHGVCGSKGLACTKLKTLSLHAT